ncbi:MULTISPECIES: hypothetical protein [Burkholderia]|uniref:hypothetical protein n=1 Tax=Burkholderia TaxID=32008 RepID=UPI00110F167F|nr:MULTISPECIES: hypothetical protein [Burkholderia]MBR8254347.1 hypothetical protein [Burkholderia ambifaria]QDW54815.1 hypothetical protein FFI87_031690 [Burkholderia sp. KBS0801]
MKTDHLIALFVVLWAWDRHNRSAAGPSAWSAAQAAFQREEANFAAMEGTNFTQSLWDPVSGQPAYMFGTIDAPGGDSVAGPQSYSGVFGHM